MKILVSGGTGLVGWALTAELAARGNQVTVLTRHPEQQDDPPHGVTFAAWDARSTEGWGHLMESAEAVINLAGASIAGENMLAIFGRRWNAGYKRLILESRLNAGRALTMAIQAAEHKPKVLLQASAIGYYGPRGDEVVDESSPPVAGYFMSDVCQAWEDSTRAVEELGIRRVIHRTGLVMSATGGILPMMLLPFRLFAGGALAGGRQYVSWIHIHDKVEAILFLLENESAEGAYNLTAPHPLTNAQFTRIAGKTLRRPSFFPVPAFALKAILGEKAALILDGQRILPRRLLDAGFHFRFPEMEAALGDLVRQN